MSVQSVRELGQDRRFRSTGTEKKRCWKIAILGAEMRHAGRLFHRLAAETGKTRLPTVVRLKDGTMSCSDMDDCSLNSRSRRNVGDAGEVGRHICRRTAIQHSVGEYSSFKENAVRSTKPVKTFKDYFLSSLLCVM